MQELSFQERKELSSSRKKEGLGNELHALWREGKKREPKLYEDKNES